MFEPGASTKRAKVFCFFFSKNKYFLASLGWCNNVAEVSKVQ